MLSPKTMYSTTYSGEKLRIDVAWNGGVFCVSDADGCIVDMDGAEVVVADSFVHAGRIVRQMIESRRITRLKAARRERRRLIGAESCLV